MTRIDFIYFDAGGGHRAAATALQSVIDSQKRPWEIRLVNLQEVLDPLDVFRKITGIRLQDIYNQMLARGWTLGSEYGLRLMHAVIRMYHGHTVQLLKTYWRDARPDMVVSLVPNFNRAMFEALELACPGVPYVTILTDFADFPPHFWLERQRQFVICGTPKAVEQARALGHAAERIFCTSGMILRPRFYEPAQWDRAAERKRLGLDPDRPTGLVLFGGQGSGVMLEIAERLRDVPLIFICGRNQKLTEKLRRLTSNAPHFVEGFTQEVPYYMYLSDFFIGKPGPGSISEAVAMKLPVIVERNAWTLVQERYNVDWVRERGVGVALNSFRHVRDGVEELLGSLDKFRQRVAVTENRAVFEIPDLLAGILESKQPPAPNSSSRL